MPMIEPFTTGLFRKDIRALSSGVLVMEKAGLLYQQLYPGKSDDDFKASSGWLHRFKKRHSIRQLSMQGESLSADVVGASEEFRSFSTNLWNKITLLQINSLIVMRLASTGCYSQIKPWLMHQKSVQKFLSLLRTE